MCSAGSHLPGRVPIFNQGPRALMRDVQNMKKMRFSMLAVGVAVAALLGLPALAQDLDTELVTCNACHGQNGQPIAPNIPIIWGQQTAFLVKQIHDYKSKDRDNPIMSALVEPIKQPDIRKVATYFAAKPWPAKNPAVATLPAPDGLTVCRICHQPNFEGGLPAPRLAGQSYDYLLAAMNSFADGTRDNNMDMVKLMQATTPAQRQTIARYLSSL
jgi:cytochrome c553